METAPEPLGSGAVLQASRREAEPRRQLLRRHTQEQQSARGGQKGQGGGAGREGEHQLLLLHHRPAQGDSSRWTARHSLSPSRLEKVRVSRGEVP